MVSRVACPECGEKYERLGSHWNGSPSHRPQLTGYQKDIVIGSMMGDGSLEKRSGNPSLEIGMITKQYLETLDNIFGVLSTGVRLKSTAEEKAQQSRDTKFHPNASEENYHDFWGLRTRRLPELSQFNWYTGENGEKVWPENINLTSTVLTHWYIGDGTWKNTNYKNYIAIAMCNEIESKSKVDQYFKLANLPTPSNYTKYQIEFTVEDSYKLFEYMDPAPPGFEYKFPEKFHNSTFYKKGSERPI